MILVIEVVATFVCCKAVIAIFYLAIGPKTLCRDNKCLG